MKNRGGMLVLIFTLVVGIAMSGKMVYAYWTDTVDARVDVTAAYPLDIIIHTGETASGDASETIQ